MFRLVSVKDYPEHAQINSITSELRRVFCEVFTNAYTERLGPALEQAIAEGKVNSAEDTKTSQNKVLRGFSDLLVKSKFFTQPIATYARRAVLREALQEIYKGPAFDDDAAFILAFHDFDYAKTSSAEAHYARIKNRLPIPLQQEVDDYFKILAAENRTLLKVDFLALVDKHNKVYGFALLHLLKFEGKVILHIRQTAMLKQGYGFVSAMAAHMVDQYPYAIYEANQRQANQVLLKDNLLSRQLIKKIPPVLHYSPDYYFGWRGKKSMIILFLHYQRTKHAERKLFTRGFWGESESIKPFFSLNRFNRDLLALQDDNFCKDNLNYLWQPPFTRPK